MQIAEPFINILEAALGNLLSLIEVSKKQLEALKKNDLELLSEAIQEQNVLFKKMTIIEEQIPSIQNELSRNLGFEEFLFDQVRVNLDSNIAYKISELKIQITQKVTELKDINEMNTMIMQQNNNYVQHMITAINQIASSDHSQVYSKEGQVKNKQSNALLNKRV